MENLTFYTAELLLLILVGCLTLKSGRLNAVFIQFLAISLLRFELKFVRVSGLGFVTLGQFHCA